MMLLNPTLIHSAPELASLEILARVLEAALVALTAAHPCLESDRPRCFALAPCRFAQAIHNEIDELHDAILNYRAIVEAKLDCERNGQLQL